jgi:hypothetical protein
MLIYISSLIAIMLGRLRMSFEDCIKQYTTGLCPTASTGSGGPRQQQHLFRPQKIGFLQLYSRRKVQEAALLFRNTAVAVPQSSDVNISRLIMDVEDCTKLYWALSNSISSGHKESDSFSCILDANFKRLLRLLFRNTAVVICMPPKQ